MSIFPLQAKPKEVALQNLQAIAAHWFVFSNLLAVFVRKIVALDKMGAREALHKAKLLDAAAKTALFDVAARHQQALALPKSAERTELLRQLDVTLFVLVGLRVLAWNIMLRRAPRSEWFDRLAADTAYAPAPLPPALIAFVAAIDSS